MFPRCIAPQESRYGKMSPPLYSPAVSEIIHIVVLHNLEGVIETSLFTSCRGTAGVCVRACVRACVCVCVLILVWSLFFCGIFFLFFFCLPVNFTTAAAAAAAATTTTTTAKQTKTTSTAITTKQKENMYTR